MIRKIILTVVLMTALVACTQMPTEKQNVVDLRPQLSFKISDESLNRARVLIDGLDVGAVSDYLEGKSALRVLSGNHLVKVVLDGSTVHEEKMYVGDGVNRSLMVK